nr:hypothetical protein [Tanacetum cinerariifolium]
MYVDGHVDIFNMIDIDLFSVVALNMMVVQLGYTSKFDPLFYNYLRPLNTLDEGLYALTCKEDVCFLATLVRSFKLIVVYIEHDVTAVIEDVMRKLSFEETKLDGEVGFGDVASSGIDSSRLSHDESFGVDDLDLNVSQIETQAELSVLEDPMFEEADVGISEVPVFEEADIGRTQEHIVEHVIVKDYVSSEEDAE